MQTLTKQQREVVGQWVQQGRTLADIQQSIADEWDITMTYMDVRFLVDDLGLNLKEEPKQKDKEKASTPAQEEPAALGQVSVSLNKVQRPGAVASGDVTFSDGVSAQWQIDQMGQLGLIPSQEGYQPTTEDVREFQTQLQSMLTR